MGLQVIAVTLSTLSPILSQYEACASRVLDPFYL